MLHFFYTSHDIGPRNESTFLGDFLTNTFQQKTMLEKSLTENKELLLISHKTPTNQSLC